MNRLILKDITIYSLVLGFILGLLSVIPYIGTFMLFALLLLVAPLIVLYMIMAGKLDLTTIKDSIIWGAASGFSANITFSVSACITLALLKIGFNYSTNYLLTTMIMNSPVWLVFICIIFLGTLVATTNAFTSFLTYYIINFIRDMYERKHNK